MPVFDPLQYVEHCVRHLAVEIGARPAGSPACRAAAEFVAGELQAAGCEVVRQEYPCPDWRALSWELDVAGTVPAAVNTYSPPCTVEAELVPVTSPGDLAGTDVAGKIVVLHGDITQASFLPKNFDRRFYVVEEQDRLVALLEEKRPAAVVAVSHYGGALPVVLEDSEFGIPSLTVSAPDGARLLENAGMAATLRIASERRAGTGANVIGRRPGKSGGKALICAHYDTKPGTPGALDNAAGIAALLLAARLLGDTETGPALKFVAYGGEDSWFPGDALYTAEYPPDDVLVAINIDGVGLKGRPTAVAIFSFPDRPAAEVLAAAARHGDFIPEQWYAGDHGFFWTRGVPTLAFTTGHGADLLGTVVHTAHDRPEVIDYRKIVQTAGLVSELVHLNLDTED